MLEETCSLAILWAATIHTHTERDLHLALEIWKDMRIDCMFTGVSFFFLKLKYPSGVTSLLCTHTHIQLLFHSRLLQCNKTHYLDSQATYQSRRHFCFVVVYVYVDERTSSSIYCILYIFPMYTYKVAMYSKLFCIQYGFNSYIAMLNSSCSSIHDTKKSILVFRVSMGYVLWV